MESIRIWLQLLLGKRIRQSETNLDASLSSFSSPPGSTRQLPANTGVLTPSKTLAITPSLIRARLNLSSPLSPWRTVLYSPLPAKLVVGFVLPISLESARSLSWIVEASTNAPSVLRTTEPRPSEFCSKITSGSKEIPAGDTCELALRSVTTTNGP